MDRKIVVCHVCGVETKRFADHIASAHFRRDFKKEKRLKEERERRLSQFSFTSDLQVWRELDEIEGTQGAEYFHKETILTFLRSKGWVIKQLQEVKDKGQEKVSEHPADCPGTDHKSTQSHFVCRSFNGHRFHPLDNDNSAENAAVPLTAVTSDHHSQTSRSPRSVCNGKSYDTTVELPIVNKGRSQDDAVGLRYKYQRPNVISIDETESESDFSDIDTVDSKSRSQTNVSYEEFPNNNNNGEAPDAACCKGEYWDGCRHTVSHTYEPLTKQSTNVMQPTAARKRPAEDTTALEPSKKQQRAKADEVADCENSVRTNADELEYFVMSVAQTMRRFTPKQQAVTKLKIQQLLLDVEFDAAGVQVSVTNPSTSAAMCNSCSVARC